MFRRLLKKKKDKKGFTMIELIIVIAIIGILAAILIPQFSNFRESAARRAAQSDGRNILAVMEQMIADDDISGATNWASLQETLGPAYVARFAGVTPSLALSGGAAVFDYSLVYNGFSFRVSVNAGQVEATSIP
jgi:type IV pilus assembly protein PilA